ncbi:hypothetical protein SNE40_009343 [Patella caerulea]|uniref:Inositol-tetrakisphosphate 1-kinase n=1 Tax=Patella caerulea TaxID=87958 RepID=A0AAN8JTY0_PATCE
MKRVGYWISEKKSKKLNFEDHRELFRNAGFELVKIDLTAPLEQQGPFDVIIHKLTDYLAKANEGYQPAQEYIQRMQMYVQDHPECIMMDPIDSLQKLLNRNKQYKSVLKCDLLSQDSSVFTPTFVQLTTKDMEINRKKLTEAKVTYPFVCKPTASHGSRMAHMMAIIFNEEGLKDINPPCVAQSFINHNAVLFKIFVIGSKVFVVERPSLKNLYPSDQATICFDTQEVSKRDSTHFLNQLDASDLDSSPVVPDMERLTEVGRSIRRAMRLDLFGVDVIIDSEIKSYAVIDINSFPGYDGIDNFFDILIDYLKDVTGDLKNKIEESNNEDSLQVRKRLKPETEKTDEISSESYLNIEAKNILVQDVPNGLVNNQYSFVNKHSNTIGNSATNGL